MPRLSSVEEWLWRLEEIRNNLHTLLPAENVRCALAVSGDQTPRESQRRKGGADAENLLSVKVQGLAGLRFSPSGDLRPGGQRSSVTIHQVLTCPKRPGLSLRSFLNVGCAVATLWEDCPKIVQKRLAWARYPTGTDGILFYAYLYGMHPLLTANEDFVDSEQDPRWERVSARFPNMMPPCMTLDFDHDWRSIMGFTLDAIRHSIGWNSRLQYRGRRERQRRLGRSGGVADYSIAAVLEMAGVSNTTLNRYAKLAGIKTPQRGKRNHRYSADEVRAMLQTIIDNTSDRAMKDRCRDALAKL